MNYTVYKITNLLNGMIYIGAHKTLDLYDSYMGSGKDIGIAIRTFGIENFKKEILFVFDNARDMYDKEAEIVDAKFVKENHTYNLVPGGFGGIYEKCLIGRLRANANGALEKAQYALSELRKDEVWYQNVITKQKHSLKKYYETHSGTFAGKKHSAESKMKMRERAKINSVGERNSQFGTTWVSDLLLKITYKVQMSDLQYVLENDNIVNRRILDFSKYEEKMMDAEIKKAVRAEKIEVRKKLADKYMLIKQEKGFGSVRELHTYLKNAHNFLLTEEALRLLLKQSMFSR